MSALALTRLCFSTSSNHTQREQFHGRFQYLFIESICNDEEVLERNYTAKLEKSPDYQNVDPSQVRCLSALVHRCMHVSCNVVIFTVLHCMMQFAWHRVAKRRTRPWWMLDRCTLAARLLHMRWHVRVRAQAVDDFRSRIKCYEEVRAGGCMCGCACVDTRVGHCVCACICVRAGVCCLAGSGCTHSAKGCRPCKLGFHSVTMLPAPARSTSPSLTARSTSSSSWTCECAR